MFGQCWADSPSEVHHPCQHWPLHFLIPAWTSHLLQIFDKALCFLKSVQLSTTWKAHKRKYLPNYWNITKHYHHQRLIVGFMKSQHLKRPTTQKPRNPQNPKHSRAMVVYNRNRPQRSYGSKNAKKPPTRRATNKRVPPKAWDSKKRLKFLGLSSWRLELLLSTAAQKYEEAYAPILVEAVILGLVLKPLARSATYNALQAAAIIRPLLSPPPYHSYEQEAIVIPAHHKSLQNI